jgi:hypothetical protein
MSHNKYYREVSLPSLLLVVKLMTKGVPVLVELVLGLHHGDSYIKKNLLYDFIPDNN